MNVFSDPVCQLKGMCVHGYKCVCVCMCERVRVCVRVCIKLCYHKGQITKQDGVWAMQN